MVDIAAGPLRRALLDFGIGKSDGRGGPGSDPVVGGKGWQGEKRSEARSDGEVTQVHELPFAEKWDGIMVMQRVAELMESGFRKAYRGSALL
jgi:hypothetical protein